MPSNPHNLAQSLLNLLGCMLDHSQGFDPTHPNIGTLLRLVFAWAFVWSVGANVDDATRCDVFQAWCCGRCSVCL